MSVLQVQALQTPRQITQQAARETDQQDLVLLHPVSQSSQKLENKKLQPLQFVQRSINFNHLLLLGAYVVMYFRMGFP